MTAVRDDTGIVTPSILAAAGWFRGAAAANLAAALGLLVVFEAVAALISSDLHRLDGAATARWAAVGVAGLAAQVVFAGAGARLAARGAGRVEHSLRRRLAGVLFAPAAPVVSSAVATRLLVEEATKVADASQRWEPIRLQVVMIPAALATVAFATNWIVGLVLLLAAPFIPLNMAMFGIGADRVSRSQAGQVAELDELVLDRIKGAPALRMLSAVNQERHRVRDAADELERRSMAVLRVALLSSAALEALVTYAVAVCATFIGLVLLGYVKVGWAPTHLSLRAGLFLLLLAPAYFQPFRDLAAAYHDRKDVQAVTSSLVRELGTATATAIPAGTFARPGPPARAVPGETPGLSGPGCWAVRADAVGFGFPGDSADIFDGLCWSVPRGAVAGVAGPSGIGKTTLLRLAAGRLTPRTGTVERGGGPLAWVSQRPYFFQATIADNLLVARPGATTAELWEALAAVGLAGTVAGIPRTLGASLGWDGTGLSGGQARRLAVARALLSGAETLVLDEPTAHLDPHSEAEVIDTIVALAPRRTIIVASHSPAVLARCSQVLDLAATSLRAELTDAP